MKQYVSYKLSEDNRVKLINKAKSIQALGGIGQVTPANVLNSLILNHLPKLSDKSNRADLFKMLYEIHKDDKRVINLEKEKEKIITFYIEVEAKNKIDIFCKNTSINVSFLVNSLIEKFIDQL